MTPRREAAVSGNGAPARPLPARVPLATEPWGVLKSLTVARRNLLELIPQIATTQPVVSGRTGKRWHMVMDPALLDRILRDKVAEYPKAEVVRNILRPAIGESLFNAEGAHWRWQRRAAAPVFQHRNIANLAPIMSAAAEAASTRLAATQGPVDMYQEMVTATFDVIASVTFSGKDESPLEREAVHRAIDAYIAQTAKIDILDMFGVPMWVPRPSRLFGADGLKTMKRLADQAIEAREGSGPKAVPDLLDLLMAGSDPETGRTMTRGELRDNVLTFIVAGHETTALTLAWALYLLAFDPAAQDRLRAEAAFLDGRTALETDAEALPFTRAVIDETLRLYPPAAFLSRTARAEDDFNGREVRVKDSILLPIYALHRHKDLWDNPDAFEPERWMSGEKPQRYAYLPFGAGPRICIGASFAVMEATIVLATLVSRFRFTLAPGPAPRPVLLLTLRPEGGVNLLVEPI